MHPEVLGQGEWGAGWDPSPAVPSPAQGAVATRPTLHLPKTKTRGCEREKNGVGKASFGAGDFSPSWEGRSGLVPELQAQRRVALSPAALGDTPMSLRWAHSRYIWPNLLCADTQRRESGWWVRTTNTTPFPAPNILPYLSFEGNFVLGGRNDPSRVGSTIPPFGACGAVAGDTRVPEPDSLCPSFISTHTCAMLYCSSSIALPALPPVSEMSKYFYFPQIHFPAESERGKFKKRSCKH